MTHHRLPADVSRCVNSQCAMRYTCLRWLCRLDNLRTSFTSYPGGEDCEAYWPEIKPTSNPTECASCGAANWTNRLKK